jgi:hypothetical protein
LEYSRGRGSDKRNASVAALFFPRDRRIERTKRSDQVRSIANRSRICVQRSRQSRTRRTALRDGDSRRDSISNEDASRREKRVTLTLRVDSPAQSSKEVFVVLAPSPPSRPRCSLRCANSQARQSSNPVFRERRGESRLPPGYRPLEGLSWQSAAVRRTVCSRA